MSFPDPQIPSPFSSGAPSISFYRNSTPLLAVLFCQHPPASLLHLRHTVAAVASNRPKMRPRTETAWARYGNVRQGKRKGLPLYPALPRKSSSIAAGEITCFAPLSAHGSCRGGPRGGDFLSTCLSQVASIIRSASIGLSMASNCRKP
jgi:hypothetical protein